MDTLLKFINEVEKKYCRTVHDFGANPHAMLIINFARRMACLSEIDTVDLPAYNCKTSEYVMPKNSMLTTNPDYEEESYYKDTPMTLSHALKVAAKKDRAITVKGGGLVLCHGMDNLLYSVVIKTECQLYRPSIADLTEERWVLSDKFSYHGDSLKED